MKDIIEKKVDYFLDSDTCITLLMINRNDYSFNWTKHQREINILIDNKYIKWESCTVAKITPKGYKRIEMMINPKEE